MNWTKRIFSIFLTTIFLASNSFAAPNNCKNKKYRQFNPEECETVNYNNTAITLLGAGALVGITVALMHQNSSDSIPSAKITNQTNFPRSSYAEYSLSDVVNNQRLASNYMNSLTNGNDIDTKTLNKIRNTAQYLKNYSQYESINFAWATARGFNGKNVNIAIMDDFYSHHGYAVSNIAQNIASESNIFEYRITTDNNKFMSYDDIANVYSGASNQHIYNNSWQIVASDNQNSATAIYNGNQIKTYAQAQEYIYNTTSQNFINQIINHAIEDDSIFVWAAGNEAYSESGVLSAIPIAFPEIHGHFVNVVSFDTNTNSLSWFSNQCGITQNYCIAAPGSLIQTDVVDYKLSGTSFATPVISGAIATIKEAFPYMTATQITQLLFTTAKDIGAPGIDSVFGWGLLDMEKATKPVGEPKIVLSETNIQPLRAAKIGGIAASAVKKANVKLAFVDDFGRTFTTNLSDHIKITNYGRLVDKIKTDETNSFSFTNGLEFGIKQNNILESNGFLSTKGNNLTNFVGYKNEYNFGNVKLYQKTRLGFSTPIADENSLIDSVSSIYTLNAKFGFSFDEFDIGIEIPDTIINGNMFLNTPVGRDFNGNMIYQKTKINLATQPAIEFNAKYKSLYIGYIKNHDIKDEFYIMAKTKFMF